MVSFANRFEINRITADLETVVKTDALEHYWEDVAYEEKNLDCLRGKFEKHEIGNEDFTSANYASIKEKEKIFSRHFGTLIDAIGIPVDTFSEPKHKNIIHYYDTKKLRVGLEPPGFGMHAAGVYLDILPDPADKSELKLTLDIVGGHEEQKVIEDILLLYFYPRQPLECESIDGKSYLKRFFAHGDSRGPDIFLRVAPVHNVQKILDAADGIYEQLGDLKLGELFNMRPVFSHDKRETETVWRVKKMEYEQQLSNALGRAIDFQEYR